MQESSDGLAIITDIKEILTDHLNRQVEAEKKTEKKLEANPKGILIDLYHELDMNYRAEIDNMKNKKKIISEEQYDLIFPSSKKTNSDRFDVTLLTALIRNFLEPPDGIFNPKCTAWNGKLRRS